MTQVLAIAANKIAARHASVVDRFNALQASAIAGTIDAANAECQAKALGEVRADLEGQMDAILRAAAAKLAEMMMPSIAAQAEKFA